MQRCVSFSIGHVNLGALLKQRANFRDVTVHSANVNRCLTIRILANREINISEGEKKRKIIPLITLQFEGEATYRPFNPLSGNVGYISHLPGSVCRHRRQNHE